MSRKFQADLLLAMCSLIWGVSFVVVKDALVTASVFVFLALRFGLAATVLVLFYGRDWRRMRFPAGAVASGTLMGCLLFGGFALQAMGIRLTTPSKAAFITGFSVILVPVFLSLGGALRAPLRNVLRNVLRPEAARQGHDRANGWVWAGAISALVGLYFLTVASPSALAPTETVPALGSGDIWVLCAAVLFALHIIAMGHYVPKHTALDAAGFAPPHATAVLTMIQMATMALLTLVAVPLFALTKWQAPRVEWTAGFVVAVLVTGILATALAFSAQVWAQQHTSSTHTAILFSLEPVFAALTSFLFLHERRGGRALAGGGLILAGILLAELRGPKPLAPEALASEPGDS